MKNRRDLVIGLTTLAGSLLGLSRQTIATANVTNGAAARDFRVPAFELLYECDVTLGEAIDFGATIEGQRRIIPITGGSFRGPRIRGQVLANGADWNLSRSDGAGSVDAAYYLRTDDGVVIRIVNVGVGAGGEVPPPADPVSGERFFMFTSPSFEAPRGRYDWMNRSIFVATLGARRDAKSSVLIRVFQVI